MATYEDVLLTMREQKNSFLLQRRPLLNCVADLVDKEGVVFALENLNLLVDHPEVPFALVEDTLALVAAVNRPKLKLNLDLYHV